MKRSHLTYPRMRQKLHVLSCFIKAISLVTASVLCLFFISCAPPPAELLSYRQGPINAEISGRITPRIGKPIEFSATLSMSEPTKCRPFTLYFRTPTSLSGMTVARHEDGSVSVSRGDIAITLSDNTLKTAIKIAEMLDSPGEILEISSISGSSVGLPAYERLTCVRTALCTLLIDPRSSLPIRASLSDGECEVIYQIIIS